MIRTYRYQIEGTAANDQTWSVRGSVECEWHQVFERVMRESFQAMTQGKAVYGRPGLGCAGPYATTSLLVRRVTNAGR